MRARGYLLTLATVVRQSEWAALSAQLKQRGIEGLIAVGIGLPRELQLPSVSVHLGAMNSPSDEPAAAWLNELGESAAEALLSKIENKSAPRRSRIVPQFAFAPQKVPGTQNRPLLAAQA